MIDKLKERERRIVELLAENPNTSVNSMSRALDVSIVTVRSDLESLADKGYIIRTHGGALPAFHPSIVERQRTRQDAKLRIARRAAEIVRDGDTIMIESGTTTALVTRFLLGKQSVKVVTDSTLLLPYIRSNPALSVDFVGGTYKMDSESMVGPVALHELRQFHVRIAFVGTDGFSVESGLTTHHVEAAEAVRIMTEHSDQTVLLADSSKWGSRGFFRIQELDRIDTIISDDELPPEAREAISNSKIEVITV